MSWTHTMWSRKRVTQFGIAFLLVLTSCFAVGFVLVTREREALASIRADLEIPPFASAELIETGVPQSDGYRLAWVLIHHHRSKHELIGVCRSVSDGRSKWSVPELTISWAEGQEGQWPFKTTFRHRPTETEIDDFVRYSTGFW